MNKQTSHTLTTVVRLLVAVSVALLLAPVAAAQVLSEAAIFIEINDTDGDAGIQLFLDGEGWDRWRLFDPDGNVILHARGQGSTGIQGLTEGRFESAEPSFDVQPLDEFLALWPEGTYTFEVRRKQTTERDQMEAELTHVLPAAPILVRPIDGDDEVDPEDLVVEWEPVADPPGSSIISYEVIVENDDDDLPLRVFSVLVDPDVNEVSVPEEFLHPGTAYKYEVLAREESGNQTISEREFETAGGDDGGGDDDDDDDDDDGG